MPVWTALIAQEPPKEGAAPDKGPAAAQQVPMNPFSNPMLWVLVVMMFFMVVIMPMMNRRQQREKDKMLQAIKRGAKVETTSGILGTVVSVKDTENEVTLRTDDGTNSRVRVLRSAIARVIGTDEKEAQAS